MAVTNEYLGASYMPGVVIAILILIFGMKILETDVPEELYEVSQNAVFPSLSQEDVPLMENNLNFCAPKIVSETMSDEEQENRKGVTNQPYNVLKSNQAGGSGLKSKSGLKGGSKKPKLYNIQLV